MTCQVCKLAELLHPTKTQSDGLHQEDVSVKNDLNKYMCTNSYEHLNQHSHSLITTLADAKTFGSTFWVKYLSAVAQCPQETHLMLWYQCTDFKIIDKNIARYSMTGNDKYFTISW